MEGNVKKRIYVSLYCIPETKRTWSVNYISIKTNNEPIPYQKKKESAEVDSVQMLGESSSLQAPPPHVLCTLVLLP